MSSPPLDVTRVAGVTPTPNVSKCLPLASLELRGEAEEAHAAAMAAPLRTDETELPSTASAEALALMAAAVRAVRPGPQALLATPRSGPAPNTPQPSALRSQLEAALAMAPPMTPTASPLAAAAHTPDADSVPPPTLVGVPVRKKFHGYGVLDGLVQRQQQTDGRCALALTAHLASPVHATMCQAGAWRWRWWWGGHPHMVWVRVMVRVRVGARVEARQQ
ncbi:hypothetical protein T492DRAFT_831366 [Pavlovales sp. CCMP2436]|nr:hypothetical protein T492DRAFT_831366 [Pavlovales sp. CCMP2436]